MEFKKLFLIMYILITFMGVVCIVKGITILPNEEIKIKEYKERCTEPVKGHIIEVNEEVPYDGGLVRYIGTIGFEVNGKGYYTYYMPVADSREDLENGNYKIFYNPENPTESYTVGHYPLMKSDSPDGVIVAGILFLIIGSILETKWVLVDRKE